MSIIVIVSIIFIFSFNNKNINNENNNAINENKNNQDGEYTLWSYTIKLPEEFDNGIPVSAVVRKKVVDRQASTENWYEEAYKFYKLPIKEAKNQNIYISDY